MNRTFEPYASQDRYLKGQYVAIKNISDERSACQIARDDLLVLMAEKRFPEFCQAVKKQQT